MVMASVLTNMDGFLSARSEEAGVSLEYLQSLHSKHEKWFIESAFKKPENGKISQLLLNIPLRSCSCSMEITI